MSIERDQNKDTLKAANLVVQWLTSVRSQDLGGFGPEAKQVTYKEAAETLLFALQSGQIFFRTTNGSGLKIINETEAVEVVTFDQFGNPLLTERTDLKVIGLEIGTDTTIKHLKKNELYSLVTLYNLHINIPEMEIVNGQPKPNRAMPHRSPKLPSGYERFPVDPININN